MTTSQARPATPPTVHRVSLPDDAAALSGLPRIDYHDAFRVDGETQLDAEQWARAVLEDAPAAVRARLLLGWTALGLGLGAPWSGERVLGWKIERRDPSYVLLTARPWLGLRGQLLFRREPDGMLFATFIQLGNPAARAVWARITATHQQTVRSLIAHAVRRRAGGSNRAEPADEAAARRSHGQRVPAMYSSSHDER